MDYYFYDDIDYDDDYHSILDSDNPKNVSDVSMLRHYRNCHGITDKLRKYLGLSTEQILDVCEYCKGAIPIKEIKKSPDHYIKEGIERQERIAEAEHKNMLLAEQLKTARETFCGVGTRQVKLILNKMSKNGNLTAKAIRLLLEAEDKNITAKDTWYHPEWVYYNKSKIIKECAEIYEDIGLKYGVQKSDNYSANSVMYFHLPQTNEQISFHTNFEEDEFRKYPSYEEAWDEQVNTTLPKLERCILSMYHSEIENAKQKQSNKKKILKAN